MLSIADKQLLLQSARRAIEGAVKKHPKPGLPPLSPALSEPHGVFVTLYRGSDLRGCIGYLIGESSLFESVTSVAVKAALSDPRFYPLTEKELTEITLEISVLSPLQRITNIDEIQVGIHGVVIESPHARSVLLPKVAVENGWDRETFLQETSRKAGGPKDLWKKPGTAISIFSAEVFCEGEV